MSGEKLRSVPLYRSDLDTALAHVVGLEGLRGCSVLITGATGTIGSFVTDLLLRYNETAAAGITVYAAGRSIERLHKRFGEADGLVPVSYDVLRPIGFDFSADYILHAAGNAHPAAFNGDPVGTVSGSVSGTLALLDYGRRVGAKRLLFVSSGEVYGQGDLSLDSFREDYAGYLDPLSPRSCYPMGKRAAENLCAAYTAQYGLETVVVRPCHTYGPGITPSDSRANAQFVRNVLRGEDIILKSSGSQLRSYNYIADCASALLTVLLRGRTGEAYNLANPAARVTIAELAGLIAGAAGRRVVFAVPNAEDLANRSPIARQVLGTDKLEALGWQGAFIPEEGVRHMLGILRAAE